MMDKLDWMTRAKVLSDMIQRDHAQDWGILMGSLGMPLTAEERAKAIADELRKGTPSAFFCDLLAAMIDPTQEGNISDYKLQLCRKNNWRPEGPDWAVALEMERLVDHVYAGHPKAINKACVDVQNKFEKKFGRKIGKRTCEAALAAARKITRFRQSLDALRR